MRYSRSRSRTVYSSSWSRVKQAEEEQQQAPELHLAL